MYSFDGAIGLWMIGRRPDLDGPEDHRALISLAP